MNFVTVFSQFGLNFRDCLQKVRTGFSGLFSRSLELYRGLVLILRLMSLSFVVCFGILIIQ